MKISKWLSAFAFVLCVAGPVGPVAAAISEPDHILYGYASRSGVPVEVGLLTVTVADDPQVIASYELGSDPSLGSLFALRVALDAVGERSPGAARSGDPAQIFLDGELAAVATLGERGTAQFLDADPDAVNAAALTIDDAEMLEGADGVREMLFTISLSLVSDVDAEVQWVTRSGNSSTGAQSGVDFRSAAGLATIAAGDSSAVVAVEIFGDTEVEADEEFFVELSNAQNAIILDPEGRGVILDDDTPPSLSINNVTATEPAAGESTTVHFTVRLSHAWHGDVGFDYRPRDVVGGAVGGSDYLLNPGAGLIRAGDLSTTVAVEILGDNDDEGEEIFQVVLENPQEATLLDGEGQGTIADFARFLVWVEAQANGVAGVDGLAGAFDLAVSPDGRHVYVVGRAQDALVVFARDGVDGRLTFIERYLDGVEGVDGLAGVEAVLVSLDGTQVFAAGFDDDAVAVFDRDAVSGALSLLEVERDGVVDNETGRTVDALAGATALAEAGGDNGEARHLYVAGHDDHAVAVFAIGADGRLRYQMAAVDGVGDVDGLRQVSDLAVSADGAHVYAAGFGDHAVVAFNRNATDGFLSFLEQQRDGLAGVDGLRGAIALATAADGGHVYAAGQLDSAVVTFARTTDTSSPAFGRLSFEQVLDDADPGLGGLASVSDLASSRDPANGDYLFASGLNGDAVVVFDRAPNGTLTLLESRRDGAGGVQGLDGANALAVSADDLNVYVAGSLESAVAVFGRDLAPPSPPTELTSTSHIPGVPANGQSLTFRWSGALDAGLGVGEYRWLLDTQPDTESFGFSATLTPHGDDPQEVTIDVTEDHNSYFLHLRTCDVARNCSATVQHLGPFHIDTSSPAPPLDVVTLSHGVPNPQPVVEMAWTPTADAGPGEFPSPLAGYATSFSLSAAPECDGELDLLDVSVGATVSPPLPAGEWFFHICTGDVAGNFSPAVTVGPLVVDVDFSPPRVLAIETVAGAEGGVLQPGVETASAITQVIAVFSEVLDDAGDGLDIHDVTNPQNYRLVAAGVDGLFETAACGGGLFGDDREVAIDAVLFNGATGRSALFLNGGNALSLGAYRLLICDAIRDLNGNSLDGDGDGAPGGDFQLPFVVTMENLLRNPNFDREIDGWGLSSDPPVALSAADSEGVTTSGSLAMERRTGDELTYLLVQCVNLRRDELGPSYDLSGLVRLTEINGLESRAFAQVELYDGPSCGGALIGDVMTSNEVIGDDSGAWQELTLELADPPPAAVSAEVSFRVEIPDNFDFDANFDRLLFRAGDWRPPAAPTLISLSHTVGVWSSHPRLEVSWDGAEDSGVGIREYHLGFDGQATTFPDNHSTIPHQDAVHTASSSLQPDGERHVHLRTCDVAANCVASVLGPFLLDATPPGPPVNLEVSVAGGNVLEASWGMAVDPAPGSGLVGYAYLVDASPSWSCDGLAQLPEGATELRVPVASGRWYVHLCGVDGAGNGGPVSSAGPFEIVDVDPPEVIRVDTVSASPGGELFGGDVVDAAVTQLLIEFNESMADLVGDDGIEDVTNPASYRLVAPGPDGSFDLAACAADLDDDLLVSLDQVLYDDGLRSAALRLADGSLTPGSYRLLLCGSSGLRDLSGNALAGGVDVGLEFEILYENLLVNPNFDNDVVGWTASDEGLLTFGEEDADGAWSSGSAAVGPMSSTVAFAQCVEAAELAQLELRSRVRIEGSGVALAELTWFSDPACAGAEMAITTSSAVEGSADTSGMWFELGVESTRPGEAASVLLTFLALPSGEGGDVTLRFDNAYLFTGLLFGDDFESGDLSRWSVVVVP